MRGIFPIMIFRRRTRTYLDWASAAPVHARALRVFADAVLLVGNPSSPHEEGRRSKEVLEEARTRIARLASVKSDAVVFTSGATEANNLALVGRAHACNASGIPYVRQHMLYAPTMHASVRSTLESLRSLGVSVEPLSIRDGGVSLEALATQLREDTVLVCVDAVCGETGIRFDTRGIARVLSDSLAKKALLHVDASQLPLSDSIERMRLKADLMTLDAQKVGGIRGIGALIVPAKTSIHPLMYGGGQEGGLRPGTEPVALAAAFAEALSITQTGYEDFAKRSERDRSSFLTVLKNAVPAMQVTEGKKQVSHILNISLPGIDTDYAVMLLNEEGIAVSTKSACETDSEKGSRAVFAFTQDQSLASSTLRISWGPETSSRELKRAALALVRTIRFLEMGGVY